MSDVVKMKVRHDRLRAEKLCINGPAPWSLWNRKSFVTHGPVVQGGRCQRCLDLKRRNR